jgi:hypothetical protein
MSLKAAEFKIASKQITTEDKNMFKKSYFKAGFTALAVTSAIAVSSVSHAAVTSFSDDFQSYTTDSGLTNWAVFSDNAGLGGYFIPVASSNGPQISALANDGAGNQYMNFFANYENRAVHTNPALRESISIFKEFDFTGADTAGGDTWVFDFEYAENPDAPVTGDTQVSAFIRVFDPVFNLLDEQVFNTLSATAIFQSGKLSTTLNPAWVEGKIQIGFNNITGLDNGSGRFYDNVNWDVESAVIPVPAAVWLFGSGLIGLVGVARRRKAQA